ncbi:electron transport complex subunit RsxG [Marinicella sp. W31]|uniref:electron transport complex subunit RsxG n=1 Tax=Marinicella sp. W31 TaxID=3023713 RepID=UPI003756D130
MDKKTVEIIRLPLILALVVVLGSAALILSHSATKEKIEEQNRQRILNSLRLLIPDALHDNALLDSAVEIYEPEILGHRAPMQMYQGLLQGELQVLAVPVTARDGYAGDIQLMVGVTDGGEVTAVSVIAHQETPGLGDLIEASKSDWLQQFPGKTLLNPEEQQWTVKKDQGAFDQITGATITPRAVVIAIKKALSYAQEQFQ